MKIKIITSPTCSYCFALKKYLDKNNVEYEEVNILEDNDLRESLNVLTLPQIEIDGKIEIIGFDKAKIDKLIEQHGSNNNKNN